MRKNLWKALSLITIFFLVVALIGQNLALQFAPRINDFLGIVTSRVVGGDSAAVYYTSDYANLQEMYNAKTQLLRDIADEGTVLLKNDGVLPLASGTIGVFGEDSFVYTTSNGGAAMTTSMFAASTRVSKALEADGLTVKDTGCDVALAILGRVNGEGNDAPQGSLALSDTDRATIEAAKASGGKVIVLLSGDHLIEAGEIANDPDIHAVLKLGNAGFHGAFGVADVITGKVSPSGKLVDTYVTSIDNIPSSQNFGNFAYTNGSKIKASQAKNYVVYAEGIYVDYRYYETRYEDSVLGQGNSGSWNYNDEVVWPFGFGLSYTSFDKEITNVSFDDAAHTATVSVKVTNTGSAAGKEVVEVYAQSPYTDYDRQNLVEKASVQLMGFAKTGVLEPGDSETLDVTVHLQWLASFDYVNAKTYIMDAGDYYFAVGNGAHEAIDNILAAKGKGSGNASLTYTWKQDKLDAETYSKSLYTGEAITRSFAEADINTWIPGAVTYMTRADWQGTFPKPAELTASADMISVLNDTKRYDTGNGNDTRARGDATEVKYVDLATQNETADALSTLGAENVVSLRDLDYDDPAWEKMLDRLTIYELSHMVANGNYSIKAAPSLTFPESASNDGPIGMRGAYKFKQIDPATGEKTPVQDGDTLSDPLTGETIALTADFTGVTFPSEPVLGATFNRELAAREGEMWGEEALYIDMPCIYGPGANTHRNPHLGRVNEYIGADPVLTSELLIPFVRECKGKGLVVTVKHFVINDQEQNRIGIGTWTNEQALREIYLRAFEGAMTYGEANGLMTSYNRIGMISTATEYDLVTGVLFNEWGSNAFVITDLGSPTAGLYDGNASIAAGVSVMMNNGVYDDASKAYVNKTLTVESLRSDPVLLRASREACHRILYNFIHSNAVNGIAEDARIELITPWWQTALTAMKLGFGILAAGSTILYLIAANRKKED
ncbi:MAG: glycoside hydrolase family 3 C-terminal domain-containing protein [Clostridia bacterium]|nr:glycoside hydrolase family 3 C-terminal domain-containing protein [Clostridia bacterium]